MANGQDQKVQKNPWEVDEPSPQKNPWEVEPAGGQAVPTPPPTIEQRVEQSQIPAYSQEATAAIARIMGTLVKLPQQLLTPHETFGASREQEVKMGPGGRLIYNMPADIMQSLMDAETARQAAAARGEGAAAQTLAYLENSLMGPFVKQIEKAGPPAPGSYFRFGPETLGGVIEAVGTIEAPRMATEALVGVPRKGQEYFQTKLGAGERMTEKALAQERGRFQGAQEEWAKNVRAQREKYQTAAEQAQREQATGGRTYQEQIDEINRENEMQQHGFQMRHALEQQMDTDSVALKNEGVKLEHEVWQEANRRMNAAKPQGNPTADSANLISKVKDVRENVLQKIPESVKEFNRIIGMENTSTDLVNLRNQVAQQMGFPNYDSIPTDPPPKSAPGAQSPRALADQAVQALGPQINPSEPLTWENLQALKTRLDARLRSGNMNSALQRAVSQVQDAVMDEMGDMLTKSGGNVADWNTARDFYREWKEDFHEPRGPQKSGSPVAQMLQAVDPAEIRKPFGGSVQSTLGNRGVNTLRKYRQWGGDAVANRVEKIIADQRAQAALPKQYKPKPYPKVPVAPEDITPFTPEAAPEARGIDIENMRYNAMRDKFAQWRTLSKWEARTAGLLGVPEDVLTWVLDRPSVLKWATKVTKADLAHIDAQPPEVRAATLKVIDNVATMEKAKLGATAAGRGPWKQLAWYKGPKPGLASLDPALVRRMVNLGLVEASLGAAQSQQRDLETGLGDLETGIGQRNLQAAQRGESPQMRELQRAVLDRRIEEQRLAAEKKRKTPGQQIRDLRAIHEKHSDNPNMPLGPGD